MGPEIIWEGDSPSGTTISEDPLFKEYKTGDVALESESPCIDAGDPSTEYDDKDGTRNNMGAFGGP